MDDFRLIIALVALGLAAWNFRRLNHQDDKNNYKDKRYLHKDCLDEAKSLLEKIETELTDLQSQRSTMLIRGSSYLGTKGADSGITNIINVIREIGDIRDQVKQVYLSLDDVYGLSDKAAFDKCMDVSCQLKVLYISSIEKLNSARLKTDQVLEVEKSHEKSKA